MDRNLKINKLYDIPLMIMMCGLPGSGKSTFADSITIKRGMKAHTKEECNLHNIIQCTVGHTETL